MKSRKPLLSTLVVGAFLCAGTLIAQDATPPPAAQDMAPAPASSTAAPAPASSTPTPQRRVPPMARVPGTESTPASTEPMPATAPAGGQAVAYSAPQGEVVVKSSPAAAPVIGPAPSFEQLSGGGKSISPEQASAYPPLANDFINADTNRNGSISKAEYTRWTKQL